MLIGTVTERAILEERTAQQPLKVRFTVNAVPMLHAKIYAPVPFAGLGRYKLGVLQAFDAVPLKNAIQTGIIPVRLNATA